VPALGTAFGSRSGAVAVKSFGAIIMSDELRAGQTVRLRLKQVVRAAAAGGYKIVRVLPDDGGEQQYRIKSALEAHERVARRSDLEKI
jgi:hypothetical protein